MIFRKGIATMLVLAGLLAPAKLWAQDDEEEEEDTTEVTEMVPVPKKFYWSNGLDGAILSVSMLEKPINIDEVTPLRFTYIANFGFNFNYDPGKSLGFFTGIGIKNIGFIEKYRFVDSTVKRRVYTIGVPLGVKIGNLRRRKFVLAGGGVDVPFNYREKGFVRRGNKEKFSEWFSDRTPRLMPYVFVGGSFDPGVTLKLQYYPGNFLNTSFTEQVGTATVLPYFGYKVNLILLSIGFDIHYKNVRLVGKKEEPVRTL